MKREFQEPRSATIVRFTNRMFDETGVRPKVFAAQLVEEYHGRVRSEERSVSFHVDGPLEKLLAANAQLMNRFRARYEENALRFPIDLEEAWVHCLCEPYRSDCRAALAKRDGLMCVPLPDLEGVTDMESVSQVTREFARALTAVAPTLEDQVIDAKDVPLIPAVLRALDALIGSATSLRARYVQQVEIAKGES